MAEWRDTLDLDLDPQVGSARIESQLPGWTVIRRGDESRYVARSPKFDRDGISVSGTTRGSAEQVVYRVHRLLETGWSPGSRIVPTEVRAVPQKQRKPVGASEPVQPQSKPSRGEGGPSGEWCEDCGMFGMVRTGTCLTCQLCGSKSGGCS